MNMKSRRLSATHASYSGRSTLKKGVYSLPLVKLELQEKMLLSKAFAE